MSPRLSWVIATGLSCLNRAPAVTRTSRRLLVLREPCEYASAVTARRLGVPSATVAISFAAAEWTVLDLVADLLEEREAGTADAIRAAPFVTRFPASLDPSPFRDTRRWREHVLPASPDSMPDFWRGRAGPFVYLTFGSRMAGRPGAAGLFRSAVTAVAPLGVQALLTVGPSTDPRELAPFPENVHVETWVDQDRVLPHSALVVCHGGSGTTYAALAHGVPVGFVPMFADQPANAAAVSQACAGRVLRPEDLGPKAQGLDPSSVTADELRDLVETMLDESSYRAGALALATEMAAQPTIGDVLGTLASRCRDPPAGRSVSSSGMCTGR